MIIMTLLYIPNLLGCFDSAPLLQQEPQPQGVEVATIDALEVQLNEAYSVWAKEEYENAFEALQFMNQTSLKDIWPVLHEADPESALRLEVQFGTVLWATEHKRSFEDQDAARMLRTILLRELNDVRRVEVLPSDQPATTKP